MDEILKTLPAGSFVLDLGCAEGSFPETATLAYVVRIDREHPKHSGNRARFIEADAANLPFADRTFAAVISNHSLEHFQNLIGALAEIRRVVRPGGSLFVAVPDSSTLTDKLYRWLARGGGHVNAFTSHKEVISLIERSTGLPHVASRVLYSSLSFLNRRNAPRPMPWRALLLGGGYEWSLCLYTWLSRQVDWRLNTRTGVYGWAFYFGAIAEPIDTGAWVNVCIRCGSGCPSSRLIADRLVRSTFFGLRLYQCPDCGATNPFSHDFAATRPEERI